MLATSMLSLSGALGQISSFFLTPWLVDSPEKVPYMNIMWFVPATIGWMLTVWKFNSDCPPTSPSPSAAAEEQIAKISWTKTLKKLANFQFVLACTVIGCFMGYSNAILMKLEQMLCARGYTDQFAGIATAVYLSSGFVATIPINLIIQKTGKPVLMTKIFITISAGIGSGFSLLCLGYDNQVPLLVVAVLMGIFSISVFPTILELMAELTYPVNQAASAAFIFFSCFIQTAVIIFIEMRLNEPLTDEVELKLQTCSSVDDKSHETAKDYSYYIYFLMVYSGLGLLGYIVGFNPEMKRTKLDVQKSKQLKNEEA